MGSDDFNMMTQNNKLLTENDPSPFVLTKGNAPLIFTFPHNGKAIPTGLEQCLGTKPEWFERAHESYDLHMDDLLIAMKETFPNASFIEGTYSRLVFDLNAAPDYGIINVSPENKDLKIPGNMPDKCCREQMLLRQEEIYWPYHEAKKTLIEEIRTNHGGAIILDMHSFTPTWDQKQREVEIGTIRAEKTPLSRALESFLKQQNKYHFVSGEPYRVADRPSNAAALLSEYNDMQYLGLEIRNDLIQSSKGIAEMSVFLKTCIDHLNNIPATGLKEIMSARSAITQEKTSPQDQGWCI